jgi:heptosyltransferase-2
MRRTDPIDPGSVRRIVIRTPNWLGDTIMALPALGAVRQAFAEAHITIASPASLAPIFQEHTNAGQNALLVVSDRRAETRDLAAGAFDAVMLLPNSFGSAWIARRAGIPERWGYAAAGRGMLLTRAVRRLRGRTHQSIYYLNLVRGLGLAVPGDSGERPRIHLGAATRARAATLLDAHGIKESTTIVGFAPGAAYGHAKRWPPVRVAELIVKLRRETGALSVLFGAGGDREAGRAIESSLPPDVRAINLIGRTDLRLLAGAIRQCSAFVSNDSGAMHLAGALGVPLVAIFGPTDERATAPLGGIDRDGAISEPDVLTHPVFCRPCMLRECPIDHRCMTRITVDRVFAALATHLHRRAARA